MKSWKSVLIAVATCAAIAGCSDNKPPPVANTGPQKAPAASVPSSPSTFPSEDPPLHDWKTPAAALLLTGEQHGYFEPCGCALHQLGGMARRGDLFRVLAEEKKWNVAGLDVGGSLKRNRRQDQIKFEVLLNAFKHLKYGGLALGVEELRLGADFLLQQQVPEGDDEASKAVPLISANVQLYDPPFPGWPLPYRIMQIGEIKVGVTGVLGASLRNQVAPSGTVSNITVRDPVESLTEVLPKLEEAKPAFLILLSHGSEDEARQLATKFPQFHVILTAGGPEEPDAKPVVVGKTWIIQAGHKGKRVGVLGYFPDNTENPFRYELVKLEDKHFKEDPYMRELMRRFQQQIQDEGLATSDELLLKHPSGNKFVGAAKCGECHVKAYDQWKGTKHAGALESLKVGHPGQEKDWIVRTHDPECLSCHVAGWEPQQMLRFDSGYFNEEKSPLLVGQQCENCHGPGSKHVSLEEALAENSAGANMDDVKASRVAARRTLEQARNQLCVECHDADNSPKYNFEKYWEDVKHPWKD